jgi:hypothetical protein
MRNRLIFAATLLLPACSQRYSVPVSASTSASPEATFECVKQQLKALGYRQTSIDVDDHRISAAKIDTKSRRPDTQFRRILNKMDVEVAAEANGQTSIAIQPHTLAEYATQRGPTEVEEKESDEVKNDSQQLLERCRS